MIIRFTKSESSCINTNRHLVVSKNMVAYCSLALREIDVLFKLL